MGTCKSGDRATNEQGRKPRPLSGDALRKKEYRKAVLSAGEKVCKDCELLLPLSAFYSYRRGINGLYYTSYCRDCHDLRVKANNAANPERCKAYSLKTKQNRHYQAKNYGISPDRYEEMVAAQNGLCAACGNSETRRSPSGAIKRLSIDHNHQTETVRELLCDRCNTVLGRVNDDPTILDHLAKYLRKHEQVQHV